MFRTRRATDVRQQENENCVTLSERSCGGAQTESNGQRIFPNATRTMFMVMLSVFLVEIVFEAILAPFVDYSSIKHILIDAAGAVFFLLPLFYFFLYRPFKQLDNERQASKKEVQNLTRQLINTVEEERHSLARDLHDDFGQIVTALQLGVETIKVSCDLSLGMGKNGENGRMNCRNRGEMLSGLIADLGDRIRTITSGLRPVMLEELGLVPTLEWLTGEFATQGTFFEINFIADEITERFSPEIELGLFRICQEALTNSAKYAQAEHVTVSLSKDDSTLMLSVKDDGVGFGEEELNSARAGRRGTGRQGFGLLGMRERASGLNGSMTVSSRKGQGTDICVTIPTKLLRRKDDI